MHSNPFRFIRLAAIAGLLASCLASCSGAQLPPIDPIADGPYLLDSGDAIRVIVYGQKEMTEQYLVDDSGHVSIPLIGPIMARGLSANQLEEGIKQTLQSRSMLADPNISVQVSTFRPFYILGEVQKPGQYPYAHHMTVLTAVAMAGGFTRSAATDTVSITRNVGGRGREGTGGRTTEVGPGDVIVVHERFF